MKLCYETLLTSSCRLVPVIYFIIRQIACTIVSDVKRRSFLQMSLILKMYSSKSESCSVELTKTSAINDKSRVSLNLLCLARVHAKWKTSRFDFFVILCSS